MSETVAATAFWRRLDTPGHDACRLLRTDTGWRLQGMAVFRRHDGPAQIAYAVTCDGAWRAVSAEIAGWLGARRMQWRIARRGAAWLLDEAPLPGLEHLIDLDLGFTPATNLLPLRRVGIAVGQSVALPALWLDPDAGTAREAWRELPQTYARRSATTVFYEAPSVGYAAALTLAPSGFIARYPGLWEMDSGEMDSAAMDGAAMDGN